jgi:hypothetical protein
LDTGSNPYPPDDHISAIKIPYSAASQDIHAAEDFTINNTRAKMPIKIPDDLPARRTLEKEGVRVIATYAGVLSAVGGGKGAEI